MVVFATACFLIDCYGDPINNTLVSTSAVASPHEQAITFKLDNIQLLNVPPFIKKDIQEKRI